MHCKAPGSLCLYCVAPCNVQTLRLSIVNDCIVFSKDLHATMKIPLHPEGAAASQGLCSLVCCNHYLIEVITLKIETKFLHQFFTLPVIITPGHVCFLTWEEDQDEVHEFLHVYPAEKGAREESRQKWEGLLPKSSLLFSSPSSAGRNEHRNLASFLSCMLSNSPGMGISLTGWKFRHQLCPLTATI